MCVRATTASPIAAAVLSVLHAATASADSSAATLPKISVDANEDTQSYKTEASANTRYSEPLLDTPQTITVIPPAVIQQRAAATLRDVLRNSPGITFQAGEGGGGLPGDQNFSLRGSSARNALFIDGVRDSGAYTRDAFVLQQVEIVKGPTAALAGRSATAGAINQITKTPQLENAQQYSAAGGSDSYARVTADANFATGEHSALRMNAMYHHADAPGRDVVENERWGFAPSFALGLGTDTRLKADYLYVEEDNVPDYGLPWNSFTQSTAADPSHNGTFPTGAYGADPKVDRSNFYGLKDFDYEDVKTQSGTAQVEHDFSDTLTLRSVLRLIDTERDSAITAPRPPNRQLQRRTMDLRTLTSLTDVKYEFVTGRIAHDLVTGVELARETTHNRNGSSTTAAPQYADFYSPNPSDNPLGPMPANPGIPSRTRVDTVALYAVDTIKFTEHWQVVAGLRGDRVETDYRSRQTSGAPLELSRDDDLFSWHGAIVYKPTADGSVYLSHGTSFDASADAGSAGSALSDLPTQANNVNLEPEKSRNLELGTKWYFFDEQAIVSAAIFRTKKTNVRTRNLNSEPFTLDGEQRIDGFELNMSGNITEQWSVYAGYSYLDSKFTQSTSSLDQGEVLPLVPKNSGNVWTTYVLPFGVTIGAGAQYVDEVTRTRSATSAALTMPDYWLFDAMATYPVTDHVTLQFNANNITDKSYVDRVGGGHFVPGPTRTYQLSASVSF